MLDTKAEIAVIILASTFTLTFALALPETDVPESADVPELVPLPEELADDVAKVDCFALAPALTFALDAAPAVTLPARPAVALNAAPTELFNFDPPLVLDATLIAVC